MTEQPDLATQISDEIESEIYAYRERTMFWPETGGITEEIARLATRGAKKAIGERADGRALTRIRDAAALHKQQLLTTTELYAVIGPAHDEPTACAAYQLPATPADSGLCARCGMSDYKHKGPTDA